MKRALVILISLSITISLIPSSIAAPKAVALGLGSVYPTPIAAESFLLAGKNAIYFSNIESETADILVTSFDLSGAQGWQRQIDSGADELVTAATIDPLGNIWLVGSAALMKQSESATSITGIYNPDGVTDELAPELRGDLNQLALWKLSAKGELLATYLQPQKSVPLASGISVTKSGISISGVIENKPFLITATASGVFGKTIFLGSAKSIFNSVIRSEDGTTSLFGSSAETLAGKKTAGKRDGILMKVSKSGAITSLVRSSANGAARGWTSADSSGLLSGYVVTGAKTEIAITKFTPTFTPSWTARYAGEGVPISITGGGNSYLAFTAKGAIPGVTGWKSTGLIVLTFDSKGLLQAATSLPGLMAPQSLSYSRERGLLGSGTSADGSVSIFTLVSR